MLTQQQIDEILERAVKQTDRYRAMKKDGASEAEIKKAFNTPEEMSVFSWAGEKDTIMTPMDSIKYYKHFLRTGFMSMNPFNGHVKAYVGGPNYNYFKYDMAMVGRRQVGSTIKPYLYALAMENGYSPCDETRHVEQTLMDENGIPWTPRNSTKKRYGELVTLKWGLANSSNWVSAYLMGKLNPYALVRLIHSFGVRNKDIMPTVSLCLGPCEISVGEMVSAYTAFANKGIRVAPLFVTRIEDNEGNVLSTFAPQMDEVISASSAYKMLVMLRAVINEGTGGRVRSRYGITADMGGKTGTTNANSDGWFMGFVPSLVSGCWVGGEERDIHFDTMTYGQGASLALPIWGKYMKKVFDDKTLGYDPSEHFQLPEGPGVYRAKFQVKKPSDTFLNFETWGKGLVYVNGYALGRIWEIGPQQTLYVPGCWLKKGENEIVVFDIVGPKEAKSEGLSEPLLDQLLVQKPLTHRNEGENLNLSGEKPVFTGSFKPGNGWQEVKFNKPVTGRYVCIEALNSQDGKDLACIAEMYFLDKDGSRLSREPWIVKYADSEDVAHVNRSADKTFDLQESTYWSTEKGSPYPHTIVIDLGASHAVTGFQCLPRMESEVPGSIKDFKIYVKGENFKY